MAWNSKTDVIVMLFVCFGMSIIALLAGVIMPVISNIRHGYYMDVLPFAAAAILVLCGMIYFLKHKKGRQNR